MCSCIEKALDKVRPPMRADGGDARAVECDETSGSVSIEMVGVCGRRHLIIWREVPEVRDIVAV
jgi:Fe-S cluster biogenesis protein NfuA